jgi:hypothetical protein
VPERLSRLSDVALEAALYDVGRLIDFPPEPNVAPAVYRRVREVQAPVRQPGLLERLVPRRPLRRALVLAIALLVLAASGAVAGLLGVPGLKLIFRPHATPSVPVTHTPSSVGANLALGSRTTFREAARKADFHPLVAHIDGFPRPEVYFYPRPSGGRVSFVYPAGPELPRTKQTGVGLLLTEFLGLQNREFLQKTIYEGGHVENVTVAGKPGFWISGAPHQVMMADRFGQPFPETLRLAGNTLVWQDGDLTLRLEGRFGKQRALAIARSVR